MIPLRWAPCKRGPILGLGLLTLASAVRADAPNAQNAWIEARPAGAAEVALRQAILSGRVELAPLEAVSTANPGSTASGLARLAAGLVLLDSGRFAEALSHLQHPDLARTALADHALLAVARAQQGLADPARAAQAYIEMLKAHPSSPLACVALTGASQTLDQASRGQEVIALLERTAKECPSEAAAALLSLASLHQRAGRGAAAAQAYDRLDREFPASTEARGASARLTALRAQVPALSAAERNERDFRRAVALSNASLFREAVPVYRSVLTGRLPPDRGAEVRVRLGRALLTLKRYREATVALAAVPKGSAVEAEAAYFLARIKAKRQPAPAVYEDVVARFPGTPWAEDALLNLAQHFQKDALEDQALPYYRRLLAAFPHGRYADRATWRVAWWEFRAGHYGIAADMLEQAAQARPEGSSASGFLYWAGRSRAALGESAPATALYQETVRRFKHTYHGLRAAEALALVRAGASSTRPAEAAAAPAALDPSLERVRQLLLIERLAEASDELGRLPASPQVQATRAWIDRRQGRLRPAITAMKRAFPQWKSQAGDELPEAVWKVIYPLEFADVLRERAQKEGLDPALVAAIVWQESTFDAGALSGAGARGLMQVIPPTGRQLARSLGVTYRSKDLYNPEVSLSFGTRYLREMLDEFGGRLERALAAYNAGPHRVAAWTASKPEMSAEEFIESIPFTETRGYVMNILTHVEHYRRIYGLAAAPPSGASGATAP